MNKLLTLIASVTLCVITSALHCAEEKPRFAWENQKFYCFFGASFKESIIRFRQEAAEASRLGLPNTRYAPGEALSALTSEAIAKIQEYLKPVMEPVEIVNTESNSNGTTLQIGIVAAGKNLCTNKTILFYLYSNPSMHSQLQELLYAQGMKHGESDYEFLKRRAEETGEFFERTADLPVSKLTIFVTKIQDAYPRDISYGFITLDPTELKNLRSIEVDHKGARLAYRAPGQEFDSYVSKRYQEIHYHKTDLWHH